MTIERLEELHTLTGQLSKEMIECGLWTDTAVDYAYDVRSLIDAEIERQSNMEDMDMDDKEVGELIKYLESALKNKEMPTIVPFDSQLIITALSQYRKPETTKIIKNEAFGTCEKCKYEFNSELLNEYNIKYCPNCGRELEL